MELFDQNGCLTEEGLHAVIGGQLDELGRLEAAEHLSYCDKCMDRYTALLTADVLEEPPHSARGAVMGTIWVRLMQNTWGRAAVAAVAAVLALTMWRTGTLEQILSIRQNGAHLAARNHPDHGAGTAWAGPAADDERPPPSRNSWASQWTTTKSLAAQASLAKALNDLLFGAGGPAAEKYKNSPLADQTK